MCFVIDLFCYLFQSLESDRTVLSKLKKSVKALHGAGLGRCFVTVVIVVTLLSHKKKVYHFVIPDKK